MKMKKTLQQLQLEWYKKLKDSGFDDIEASETKLRDWSYRFVRRTINTNDDLAEYYRLAEFFVQDYKFETELERVIWEYHANGLNYPEILKIMQALPFSKKWKSFLPIRRVIYKLRKKMFRMYNVNTGRPTNEQ